MILLLINFSKLLPTTQRSKLELVPLRETLHSVDLALNWALACQNFLLGLLHFSSAFKIIDGFVSFVDVRTNRLFNIIVDVIVFPHGRSWLDLGSLTSNTANQVIDSLLILHVHAVESEVLGLTAIFELVSV